MFWRQARERRIASLVEAGVAAALEQRATIENPTVPISSPNLLAFLGLEQDSEAGETVTIDSALGVPAVWAAVNFLSRTLAALPLHVYRRQRGGGRERVGGRLAGLLHDAANDELTSFDWRKGLFESVLTGGRHVTYIERTAAGQPINLWPLDPTALDIRKKDGRLVYRYAEPGAAPRSLYADDVIDITFMRRQDGWRHRSPIYTNKEALGLAQAVTKYGARYFRNGGVPPFAITGPFASPLGVQAAARDMADAVMRAAKDKRLALALPSGHEIKQIGADPEKSQLVELQRFVIEQVARIYSLPPVFLQDLTHGTFSNTEQQDLHLVKHTLTGWLDQFEKEANLKLFGRSSGSRYVEHNLDGLLRGDFKTRMDGLATAIQNALMTPNEARRAENRPDDPEGGRLLVQGATVPLGSQPAAQSPKTGGASNE